MKRTPINPWPWSRQYAFNQGELVEGFGRMLVVSGQIAVDVGGVPKHPGDMTGQISLALDNLEAVLAGGGMSLADVVRLTIYTTDVDAFLPHNHVLADRLTAAGVTPAATLLGVARLAFPELLVELEATAVQ